MVLGLMIGAGCRVAWYSAPPARRNSSGFYSLFQSRSVTWRPTSRLQPASRRRDLLWRGTCAAVRRGTWFPGALP